MFKFVGHVNLLSLLCWLFIVVNLTIHHTPRTTTTITTWAFSKDTTTNHYHKKGFGKTVSSKDTTAKHHKKGFGISSSLSSSSSSSSSSTSTSSTTIQVTQVKRMEDWHALADIRFNEWIDDGTTSRDAFRWATIDIYQEERPNSVLFLARKTITSSSSSSNNNNKNAPTVVVVGAAELSPYELVNAIINPTTILDTKDGKEEEETKVQVQPIKIWYVTDVVTDQKYRRQGIAKTLMETLEKYATNVLQVNYLILNVAPDNQSAIEFYQTLGYTDIDLLPPSSSELYKILNVDKLSENAGTHGELVMSKTLLQRPILS